MPLKESARDALREQLAQRVQKAIDDDTFNHLDLNTMSSKIIELLDARKHDVIWTLLGLDARWGKWEIDHCNGRQSLITKYLAEAMEPVIARWVNATVEEVVKSSGDKMRKAVRQRVSRDLEDRYARELRHRATLRIDEIVDQEAKALAEGLFSEVLEKTIK